MEETLPCPACSALVPVSSWSSHQGQLHAAWDRVAPCGDCAFQACRLQDAIAHALLHGHELPKHSDNDVHSTLPLLPVASESLEPDYPENTSNMSPEPTEPPRESGDAENEDEEQWLSDELTPETAYTNNTSSEPAEPCHSGGAESAEERLWLGTTPFSKQGIQLHCRKCGKTLCTTNHARSHIAAGHARACRGLRPFSCSACGQSVAQKANMYRHTKNVCKGAVIETSPDCDVTTAKAIQECFPDFIPPKTLVGSPSKSKQEQKSGKKKHRAPSRKMATAEEKSEYRDWLDAPDRAGAEFLPIASTTTVFRKIQLECAKCSQQFNPRFRDRIPCAMGHSRVCQGIRPFSCSSCGYAATLVHQTQAHVKQKCTGATVVTAEGTEAATAKAMRECFPTLRYEKRITEKPNSFQCSKCKRKIQHWSPQPSKRKERAVQHALYCCQIRPFACSNCPYVGSRKWKVIHHIQNNNSRCGSATVLLLNRSENEEALRKGLRLCFPDMDIQVKELAHW